jgi:uncharacterized protein YdeI (YjbR/CyaY-like superfamily)
VRIAATRSTRKPAKLTGAINVRLSQQEIVMVPTGKPGNLPHAVKLQLPNQVTVGLAQNPTLSDVMSALSQIKQNKLRYYMELAP